MSLSETIRKERYAQHGEETWSDTAMRVAKAISKAEQDDQIDKWTEIFHKSMVNFDFIPGGRIISNAGKAKQYMMNCNLLDLEDSRESIGNLLKDTLVVSGTGGGVGVSFSTLRPKGAPIQTNGGLSSGPISFMHCADSVAGTIKTGSNRRAALMLSLSAQHPDILDFLHEKLDLGKLNNANVSVEIDQRFIEAVKNDENWELVWAGKTYNTVKAKEIWDILVKNALASGEPGIMNLGLMKKLSNSEYFAPVISTNPCFIGSTRIATSKGLIKAKELYNSGISFGATIDKRTVAAGGRKDINPTDILGVDTYDAIPMFKTGHNIDVFNVTTVHGHELTVTDTHKFMTPNGYIELKDINIGDNVLLQSGEGAWSKEYALPSIEYAFTPSSQARLKNKTNKGEASIPLEWAEDLGILIGYFIGNGYLYNDNGKYVWGISVNNKDSEITEQFKDLVKGWFGIDGHSTNRNNCTLTTFKGYSAQLLLGLGCSTKKATEKRIPESIFKAPREVVVGFLKGLFSADGTINVGNSTTDIRLSSSSLDLLKDVQLLLSNFGIVCKIYLRRKAGVKMLPDSNRNMKEYNVKAQYEIIMFGENRNKFMETVGFMQSRKNDPINSWINDREAPRKKEKFTTTIESIKYAGKEDVYDTTVKGPHSIIIEGVVTAQCGEQPLEPFGSCDLGSVNVSNFAREKYLDVQGFKNAIEVAVRFLDNVISVNTYPLENIRLNSTSSRRIGLGITGLHYAMLKLGIKYGSEEGVAFAEKVYEILRNHSYFTSAQLAEEKGSFPKYDRNKYLEAPFIKSLPTKLRNEIREKGIRNVCLNTQAPCGTTSILANVSSGIEPIFAPVYERRYRSHDGKGNEVTKTEIVSDELFSTWIEEGKDISHFEGSHDVSPEWHIKVQEAAQRYIDSAVSKTVNLPKDYSANDLSELLLHYMPNLKGITVYKDGSRGDSPLVPLDPSEYRNRTKGAEDVGKGADCASGTCEI